MFLFMSAHLLEVCKFVGVKDKMDKEQINAVCQQIYNLCPTLTMTEFILFCARVRSGKYESFYGSVDPLKILKSFDAFLKDRSKDYIEERYRKNEEEKMRKEQESKPCVGKDLEEMLESGRLPFLDKIRKQNSGKPGKYSLFLASIQELIKFKQNNS